MSAKQFKYSFFGGIGLLLAIAGFMGFVFGLLANRPPAFIWPLGLVVLFLGAIIMANTIPVVRRMQQEKLMLAELERQARMAGAGHTAEPDYSYSLDYLPPLLEPVAEQIRKLAVPSVSLMAAPSAFPLSLTASKFGGTPYLPKGSSWPMCPSGKPMTFVGQLNFKEIFNIAASRNQELPPDMPPKGILSFFYDMETMMPGFEKDSDKHCRFFWDPEPVEQIMMPVPEQFDAPIECKLIPSVRMSLPSSSDRAFGLHDVSDDVQEEYDQLRAGILLTPAHQILGYAAIIQDDPCYWASRSRVGHELGGDKKPWRLLWQIDTDENASGFMWGDLGTFYILIMDEDLKNRRFDRLQFGWQCY